jgi:CRISPR system Cascade subunit CasE
MTMHFSLITPTTGHERAAAHDWAQGVYGQHQWLWRFLPAPPGSPRSFLFRRRDMHGLPCWYVVSECEPQSPSEHWQVRSKPYAPDLAEGQLLSFELRANAVVTTRSAAGKPVRHDVVMQEKKRLLHEKGLTRWADWTTPDRPALADLVQRTGAAWLAARCARLGVALHGADTLRVEGYEQHRGKGDTVKLSTVDFSGSLRVTDPTALRRALFEGVGHGKAFGCGLLLVRPFG